MENNNSQEYAVLIDFIAELIITQINSTKNEIGTNIET